MSACCAVKAQLSLDLLAWETVWLSPDNWAIDLL